MKKVLVLNGPNLNMLGIREPEVYGRLSLADIEEQLVKLADSLGGLQLEFFQSNVEGELINRLHQAYGRIDGIIVNPGAFTHYSYALRDAFGSVSIPAIEIHLSNIHQREAFRHISVLAPLMIGQIAGFGAYGYELALMALKRYLEQKG